MTCFLGIAALLLGLPSAFATDPSDPAERKLCVIRGIYQVTGRRGEPPEPQILTPQSGVRIQTRSGGKIARIQGVFYAEITADGIHVVHSLDNRTAHSVPLSRFPDDFHDAERLLVNAISPDGNWIVVDRIFDSETATGALVHLPTGHIETRGFEQTGMWRGLQFSPDSRSLAFSRFESDLLMENGELELGPGGRRETNPRILPFFSVFSLRDGRFASQRNVVVLSSHQNLCTYAPIIESFACFARSLSSMPPELRLLSGRLSRQSLPVSHLVPRSTIQARRVELGYAAVELSPSGLFALVRHHAVTPWPEQRVLASGVDIIRLSPSRRIATINLAEEAFQIAISPDDRLVAFETREGIVIYDVEFPDTVVLRIAPPLEPEVRFQKLTFADLNTLVTLDHFGNAMRWTLPPRSPSYTPYLRVVRP